MTAYVMIMVLTDIPLTVSLHAIGLLGNICAILCQVRATEGVSIYI